jgi:purine-nucleoside phosphorylase
MGGWDPSAVYRYDYRIERAAKFLRPHVGKPVFGIVLGSGLGDLADTIEHAERIPFDKIPDFPALTVAGHAGNLIIGELEGIAVIGLQGRKHFYELADEPTGMQQVVLPVHVLAELGVPNYFATNAVGGLNLKYKVGDTMCIRTHINFLPNPLLGKEAPLKRIDGSPVWTFQPMNGAYDKDLRSLLMQAAPEREHMHEGTYLAVSGRTYETEGESIAFRNLGADAVGMSVAPEVIVARNRGMRVVGMSCITNTVDEYGVNNTSHEEVMAVLNSASTKKRLTDTVTNFFALYKQSQ